MIIPLRVRKKFDQLMPFAFITVKAHHVRPIPVEALVDTGSPWLALTPKDIRRLNISISALKRPKKFAIVYLAGSKFWRYLLTKATIRLRAEGDEIVRVRLPSVSVLWPTKGKPKDYEPIPNVMGSDFLTVGQFHLHFNPCKRIAFLERENEKQT